MAEEHFYDKDLRTVGGHWENGRFYFPSGISLSGSEYTQWQDAYFRAHKTNLNNAVPKYDRNLGSGFFKRPYEGFDLENSRSIVTFDIETDSRGNVITLSALKHAWDQNTQSLKLIGNYQRFYNASDRDLVVASRGGGEAPSISIHGLNSASLAALRKKQRASYSSQYNEAEARAFKAFLGDSIIAGHNLLEFDIPKTIGFGISNQVIDTLIAAENIYGRGKSYRAMNGRKIYLGNDLDSMFKRVTGMSMAQAGLGHHDSGADVVANAIIVEALLRGDGPTGNELRALLWHRGLKYGPKQVLPYANGAEKSSGLFFDSDSPYGFNTRGIELYYDAQDILDRVGLVAPGFRPEGFNFEKEARTQEDRIIMETSTVEVLKTVKDMLANNQGLGEHYAEFARIQGMNFRARVLSAMAGANEEHMGDVARGMGFKGNLDPLIAAARAEQEGHHWSSMYSELKGMVRGGYGDTDAARNLRNYLSESDRWGGRHMLELDRLSQFAQEKQYKKMTEGAYQGLSQSQKDYVFMLQAEGASYDTLTQKIKDLVGQNERMEAFGDRMLKIKAYDPNQYVTSARKQLSGVLGASQGLVPSSLLGVAQSTGNALFNAVDRALVPYNRAMSVWNSGLGDAVGAGIGALVGGGPIGAMIGIGAVKGATQIFGNIQQGKMEATGYALQGSLNTANAIMQWATLPLKALNTIVKQLTGSFRSLLSWTKRLMSGGIDLMSQMGNPLTMLSGVDYVDYQKANLVDVASLLSKGSLNDLYEKIASNKQNLFTMGQYDAKALQAAAMLGVFNEAFVPGANGEKDVDSMINNIYGQLRNAPSENERARIMNLAGMINPTIPQIVQTMNVMGVSSVGQLKNPEGWTGMKPYHLTDVENRQFRRTQYEWGIAQQGFSNIKMRLANTLWKSFGKDLYNGIGEIVNSAAGGDWDAALKRVSDLWKTLKGKVTEFWEAFKNSEISSGWKTALKEGLLNLEIFAIDTLKRITVGFGEFATTVWDNIQGLVDYVRNLSFGFNRKTGQITIESAGSKAQATYSNLLNKPLYNVEYSNTPISRQYYKEKDLGLLPEFLKVMGIDLGKDTPFTSKTVDLLWEQVRRGKSASVAGIDINGSSIHSKEDLVGTLVALSVSKDPSMVRAAMQETVGWDSRVNYKFPVTGVQKIGRGAIDAFVGASLTFYDSQKETIAKLLSAVLSELKGGGSLFTLRVEDENKKPVATASANGIEYNPSYYTKGITLKKVIDAQSSRRR